jgi:hypothetical protein
VIIVGVVGFVQRTTGQLGHGLAPFLSHSD